MLNLRNKEYQSIRFHGESDDLIEIDAGKYSDEFSADDINYVHFSTGDVFEVEYTDGIWRIMHIKNTGALQVSIDKADDDEDQDEYWDLAIVKGQVEWVDCWNSITPKPADIAERIMNNLDEEVIAQMPIDQLLSLYHYVSSAR